MQVARWDIPGGIVGVDESPRPAVRREVLDEIGLDLEPGPLLVVDGKPSDGDVTEVVALLFDGGILTAQDVDRTVTDPSEVRADRFVELDEAALLLDDELFARVSIGLAAGAGGRVEYLENGPPGWRAEGQRRPVQIGRRTRWLR
jgi:ADP-ribose pyrophosphatase YjhB (NUDIX family)